MSSPFHCIGVISIGDMGVGIAQLLLAYGYRVVTFAADRSETTQKRATSTGVDLLPSLEDLATESNIVLSIVPPKDALQTAQRIITAVSSRPKSNPPLYFLDLNAVSPRSARETAQLFNESNTPIIFIDGAIIGGPPRPTTQPPSGLSDWKRPTLPTSGPAELPDAQLREVLNISHLSPEIGTASGLKMCFASLTKGFISLAIQSFTTAHGLGVLPELRELLRKHSPSLLPTAENGLPNMPHKAYRWIHEMQQIGDTMSEESVFEKDLFYAVAAIYEKVANNPVLGTAKAGESTVESVVRNLSENTDSASKVCGEQ